VKHSVKLGAKAVSGATSGSKATNKTVNLAKSPTPKNTTKQQAPSQANKEASATTAIPAKTKEQGKGNIPKVTKGYDVTPLKSTYQERLNQTPVNNGKWTGERGESTFISDKPEVKPYVEKAGVKGVEYKNAMPDFSPFSKAEFEITGMFSSRPSNFSKADELLAKQWSTPEKQWKKAEVAKWRSQNKYTWHELNDGKTIQLVPRDVNFKFGHLGGVSEVK
ncbi:HNH endonuclease, partial [Solibacillus ferritrahens]|uniref:HNH endonuclease n=1 Tax=Solibacillus ferritrahens TaxID=3098620 RepID=UPI00300A3EEB